jgi:hypothetical protein
MVEEAGLIKISRERFTKQRFIIRIYVKYERRKECHSGCDKKSITEMRGLERPKECMRKE